MELLENLAILLGFALLFTCLCYVKLSKHFKRYSIQTLVEFTADNKPSSKDGTLDPANCDNIGIVGSATKEQV